MSRRVAIAVVAVLVLTPTAVGLATAAPNGTATPTATATPPTTNATDWQPPGQFTLTELRRGGRHDADAPPSIRMLGDPVRGGVGVRYEPANPLRSEMQFVNPGELVQRNTIQLYSTAFGEAVGEYTVHIVYWQPATKRIQTEDGVVTRRYAANQSHKRVSVDLGNGYDTTNVSLAPHYDSTYQVTMWLSRDGAAMDGIRWRFAHKSIPSTAAVSIDSQGDAWKYTAFNGVIPGAIGVVAGLGLSRSTLKRTGTGPRQGWLLWGIAVTFGGTLIIATAYFQLATIAAQIPWLMGLSLGLVAYVGGMRMHPEIETIAFERQELKDALPLRNRNVDADHDGAVAPDGGATTDAGGVIEIASDEYKEELYEDQPQLPSVRMHDGTRHLPVPGIRPWLARLWADAAKLDIADMRTRIRVRQGPVDEKLYTDPESETAIDHKPATLRRRLPFWNDVDEDAEWTDKLIAAALAVGSVAGPPLVGMRLLDSSLGLPGVGFLVGAIPALVLLYTAEDGHLEFDPAPIHHRSAKATLTALQKEHRDAKLLEEFEEIAWSERTRTAQDARDVERRRDETYVEETFGGERAAETDGGEEDDV